MMTRRDDYLLGQAQVVQALANATKRDRLAHGLLFVGPDGIGRERAARGLAAGLLCEADDASTQLPFGCGVCRGCRRVESGTHPDIHVVLPDAEAVARGLITAEKKVPSRDIRVEQIRDLAHQMRLRPYEGRARVAIVADAHRMNPASQNALLKTLEEPGPASLIVLIAPHARSVLPTIESRCQRVRFRPLTPTVVETILTRLGVENAQLLATGAESVAQAVHGDNTSDRAAAQEFLDELYEATANERLDLVEKLGRDRGQVDIHLREASALCLTALRQASLSGEDNVDGHPVAIGLEIAHALAETRAALAANAHVQIALEDLVLRLTSPRAPAHRIA